MRTIKEWQQYIHEWAVRKKWWTPGVARNIGEIYSNFHSEISEGWEHYRNGRPVNFKDKSGKPDGEAVELADAIIRILDYAEWMGWIWKD